MALYYSRFFSKVERNVRGCSQRTLSFLDSNNLLQISTISLLHKNLQVGKFQNCEHECRPQYTSCCAVLLYFLRYCTVRFKIFTFCVCFLCLFFMYVLLEKYYKPSTVQYYITACVSWVPRLNLLDLKTN